MVGKGTEDISSCPNLLRAGPVPFSKAGGRAQEEELHTPSHKPDPPLPGSVTQTQGRRIICT